MSMPEVLSSRQRRILEVIRDFSFRHGRPPYMEEIRETVGLGSQLDVYNQLMVLKRMGLIKRDESDPLAIQVTRDAVAVAPSDADVACIPLVGTVAAGMPVLAEEHIEDEFHLPRKLVGAGEVLIMLKVRGDSMHRAGVLDGDYVIVKQGDTPEPGQVVAARFDNEATVKTFAYRNGRVCLLPESDDPRYQPIDGENAEIIGRVVMVIRQMPRGRSAHQS
jgi:repressor LexA